MTKRNFTMGNYASGLVAGAVLTLVAGLALIYALNMTRIVAISVVNAPDIHRFLGWAYDNLRLSIIPFTVTILCFGRSVIKLRRLLLSGEATEEKVVFMEHLIEVWIFIFFGIGVTWTAIGMRGALIEGLGNLDAASAARDGAFAILQRLVDGGILIALSTTIFGSVGGFLMQVIKTFALKFHLEIFFTGIARRESLELKERLESAEIHLAILSEQATRHATPPSEKEVIS